MCTCVRVRVRVFVYFADLILVPPGTDEHERVVLIRGGLRSLPDVIE